MQVVRNNACQNKQSLPRLALVFSSSSEQMADLTGITRHAIVDDKLGLGEPLSMQTIQELLADLTGSLDRSQGNTKGNYQFIPSNVLLSSPSTITWYQPSREGMLWLQVGGERCGFQIRWPALVFNIQNGSARLSVAALETDERPTPENHVYDVPMPNCYHGGGFCLGSATLPREINFSTLPEIEACMYEALKTHSNNSQALADGSTPTAFWVGMDVERRKTGVIPTITASQMTRIGYLGDWIEQVASR